jgi:LPXTG-motif cell wall-anchored protein
VTTPAPTVTEVQGIQATRPEPTAQLPRTGAGTDSLFLLGLGLFISGVALRRQARTI